MGVVPLVKQVSVVKEQEVKQPTDWTGIAASGALIAGGLLLLAGKRRLGTVVAASGAALMLMQEQETACALWEQLPGYVDEAQNLISRVQDTVEEVAERREDLRRILAR
jgi:hypothetical protein